MGKDARTPAAPDPNKVAQAQAGYDQNTALFNANLNRYNVSTPFGNLAWNQTPSTQKTFNQDRYNQAVAAAQAAGGNSYGPGSFVIPGDNPSVGGGTPGGGSAQMPDRNDPQFWDTTGAPSWSQQITLNPTAQATLNATQQNGLTLANTQGQMLANAQAKMEAPIDTSGLPRMVTGIGPQGPLASGVNDYGPGYAGPVAGGDLGGLGNRATQASFDSAMGLLQPQMDIERKQLQTQLANQGMPVGSEGYTNQMGSLDRQQDWARQQAANNAVLTGQNYENQLFGQGLQNANLQNTAQAGYFGQGLQNANLWNQANQIGFGQNLSSAQLANAANQQGFQQMLALRNQPLNEYLAMQNGTQIQTPQFQGTPAINANAPNYQGAVGQNYQGQLNAYNAQTGANNSFMNGLFNLGSAAIPFLL